MKALFTIVCLAAGQEPQGSPAAPALRVEVPEAARVRGIQFRLGEVVSIEGENAALVAKAKSILVGYSPSPGYERRIRRESVGDLLVASGILRGEFRVAGFPWVSVLTETAAFDPTELRKAGEAFLAAQCRDRGLQDFRIEAHGLPSALQVPAGREGVRVEAAWRGEARTAGQAGVDLRVLVDGEPFGVVPMVYTIRSYGMAAAASRTIGTGESLGPANVEFRRVEIPAGPTEALFSMGQLVGREAARAIPAGEVVTTAHVKQVPLVQKDQMVTVTLRGRGITMTLRGRCGALGYLGSIVPVENPTSGKPVYAKVVGPGDLEILQGGSR